MGNKGTSSSSFLLCPSFSFYHNFLHYNSTSYTCCIRLSHVFWHIDHPCSIPVILIILLHFPPLPPRGASSRRRLLNPPLTPRGSPRPPTAGPLLGDLSRFPRSPAGAQPQALFPFPLISLPDAAIMLKPQPPQQTSQPQQPPPTQQAVARRPPGGTSPPNGGLPGPLPATAAPPGPPTVVSPCLGPAAAAGSGLRRGAESILAAPAPQQHQERPGAVAIGSVR